MRHLSLKRVTGYGVAAATVLGSTQSNNADIISFTGIDATGSTITNNNATLLSFSLTGVVATDGSHVANEQFYFSHTYATSGKFSPSSKLQVNNAGGLTAFNANPQPGGTTIGYGQAVDPTTTGGAALTGFGAFPGPGTSPKGSWSAGQEAYLALRFDNAGATNYGFADITVNSATSVTLHGFSYDNTGAPIVTPIPEPTQIALFATGAAGVALYHRRRKQTVKASR